MSLFSKLFGAKSQDNNPLKDNYSRNETAASFHDDINNEEIVAAIMGALTAMMSADAVSDIKVRAIRRIGRTSPVWNLAGRDEYLASKL